MSSLEVHHVNSNGIEQSLVRTFIKVNNHEAKIFIDKMEDMIQIYNQAERIYFDKGKHIW